MNPFTRQSLRRLPAALLGLLLLAAVPSATAKIEVAVEPDVVAVGETASLVIVSDSDKPEVSRLPNVPGLTWLGGPQTSISVQFINFKRSVKATTRFMFQAEKAGTFTFPEFTIQEGKQNYRSKPIQVRVEPAAVPLSASPKPAPDGAAAPREKPQAISLDDAFFAELVTVPGGLAGESVYASQEVPVEIRVHVAEEIYRTLNFPELRLENAVILPAVKPDARDGRFETVREQRETRNGIPFKLVVFRTSVAPVSAGTMKAETLVTAQLVLPTRQRGGGGDLFDDAFFRDIIAQTQLTQRQVRASLGPIQVAALPPPPPDASYVGLTGEWTAECSVTPASVAAGDPATVTVRLNGTGNSENLLAPKLPATDCRVFDPETKKERTADGSRIELSWVAIPLQTKARIPEFAISTFDPKTGAYQTHRFRPALTVTAGAGRTTPTQTVVDSGAHPAPGAPAPAPVLNQSDILYIKAAPGAAVCRPLYLNRLLPALLSAGAGLLAFAGLLAAAARRDLLHGNHSYRRLLAARRDYARALRRLKHAPPEERAKLIRENLVPSLAARLDLPPGTTSAALAEHLENAGHAELAAILRQAEEGDFRPGAKSDLPVADLLRFLGRVKLLILPVLLFLLPGGAGPDARAAAPDAADDAVLREATTLYDRDRIEEALRLYRTLAAKHPEELRANLLFNEGNCLYRLGRNGEAVAKYETARRLAPRDSDIVENLNFVRARLNLPLVRRTETPADLLRNGRDLLRPDEWMLAAGVILGLAGLLAGWRRWRRFSPWPALAAGAAGACLCGVCILSQLQSTYRPDAQAVLLPATPAAYRLPADNAGRADLKLRQGDAVLVMESRGDWTRIRAGEAEAWLRTADLGWVW